MSGIKALLQAKYSPIRARFRVTVALFLGFVLTQPGFSQEVEDQVSDIVSEATEERIEQAMEDLLTDIESRISEDALRIQTDHWLVMAEADVFEQLAQEGYLFDRVSELEGLGFLLAEVAAPASFDLSATRAGIYEVIGGDRADVDLNHLYTAGVPNESDAGMAGVAPRELLALPPDLSDMSLRIGIIDSSVDLPWHSDRFHYCQQ